MVMYAVMVKVHGHVKQGGGHLTKPQRRAIEILDAGQGVGKPLVGANPIPIPHPVVKVRGGGAQPPLLPFEPPKQRGLLCRWPSITEWEHHCSGLSSPK